MSSTESKLLEIISRRILAANQKPDEFIRHAEEIIVFGSVAVGLDRPDSDVDVMCIGGPSARLKTQSLDFIAVPRAETRRSAWLQSELTTHIARYGVWVKGSPNWIERVEIGEDIVREKRRRVEAFMRHLPHSWHGLDRIFKVKYSIKVRREAQRLLLLNQGIPVPPTKMLDATWANISKSPHELQSLVRELLPKREDGILPSIRGLRQREPRHSRA